MENINGRPPMFTSPKELSDMVRVYFSLFEEEATKEQRKSKGIDVYETRPTITGLTLFLGFESRQSFYDYEKKPDFTYAIKSARTKIENIYENMLGSKTGTVGAIFALKNMDWTDKQSMDITSKGEGITQLPPVVYNTGPKLADSEDSIIDSTK